MISRNLLSDTRVRGLLFPLLFAASGALISNFVVCRLFIVRFGTSGNWVVWVVKLTVPQVVMVIPYVIPRFFFKQKGVRALFHICLLVAIFVFYTFLTKNSANFPLHSALIINIVAISGISALCVCSLLLDPRESLRKGMSVLMIAIFVRFICAWGIRSFSFHLLAMAETFLFLGIGLGLVLGDLVGEKALDEEG